MREIRQSGSEGGAAQTNGPSLPLSPCIGHIRQGFAPGHQRFPPKIRGYTQARRDDKHALTQGAPGHTIGHGR